MKKSILVACCMAIIGSLVAQGYVISYKPFQQDQLSVSIPKDGQYSSCLIHYNKETYFLDLVRCANRTNIYIVQDSVGRNNFIIALQLAIEANQTIKQSLN
ncbi:MAG TPA: hypothetical protein PK297_12550 [Spirochaetota bacterium]|nr:hypothetical protein [Spirochaetota bacterium]